MTTEEKVCLKWNDHSTNLGETFSELRADQCLLDVTLACEDGKQIEAHKVVLTAGSLFFRNIINIKKLDTLIIYMRGFDSSDLASVVDFLYDGEVNVLQEELNDFLCLAEELQIKGLMGEEYNIEEQTNMKLTNPTIEPIHKINTKMEPAIQTYKEQLPNEGQETAFENLPLVTNENLLTSQIENIILDKEIKQNMDDLIALSGDEWSCKVCGKVANKSIPTWKRNLQKHTLIHMKGPLYACNLCGKEFGRKDNLVKHMSKFHVYSKQK